MGFKRVIPTVERDISPEIDYFSKMDHLIDNPNHFLALLIQNIPDLKEL